MAATLRFALLFLALVVCAKADMKPCESHDYPKDGQCVDDVNPSYKYTFQSDSTGTRECAYELVCSGGYSSREKCRDKLCDACENYEPGCSWDAQRYIYDAILSDTAGSRTCKSVSACSGGYSTKHKCENLDCDM